MNKNKNKKNQWVVIVVGGLFIGLVNGFFGGGGGMLAVPLMTYLLGIEDKTAHASAILVILPLSIASGFIYITNQQIDLDIALFVGAGVLAGGVLGAMLLNKLKNRRIAFLFALVMIGAGIGMIV